MNGLSGFDFSLGRYYCHGTYKGCGFLLSISDMETDCMDVIWSKFFHSNDMQFAKNYIRKVAKSMP